MANTSEQNAEESNAYIEKLLAALKQLQQFIGVEVVVQNAISNTKNLQGVLRDSVPKTFDASFYLQVVEAMHRLRESLETLTEQKRAQALHVFAVAQEACLNLSENFQVGANSKYQTLKASALDAAAAVDIDMCITSLKNMQIELVGLTTTRQQKLHDLVTLAVEKATDLHGHWRENYQSYFQDTVTAVSNIRTSLVEFSCKRKDMLLEAYTTCQESLLSLMSRLRSSEAFLHLKDQALDATVHLDMANAIATLKTLAEEVKSLNKEKLTKAVALTYEKATKLEKSLQDGVTEKAAKYYEEAIASLHQIRMSLQDTASEKKAAALLIYAAAQDSFFNLAQKVRKSEKGHILYCIKDRALETAIFLDDRYALWQKVWVYAEAALIKGKGALENKQVVGAIDLARSLDNKIAQGTVNSVVEKGYGMVEAGAAYLKEEVQAVRQRQQNGAPVESKERAVLVEPKAKAAPAEPKANPAPAEPKAKPAPEPKAKAAPAEPEEKSPAEPKAKGSVEPKAKSLTHSKSKGQSGSKGKSTGSHAKGKSHAHSHANQVEEEECW